jgi:hypothetical protein
MFKGRYKIRLLGSFIAFMFLLVATATAAGDPLVNKRIEKAIAKVRAAESLGRNHAAEELLSQMMGINPASVDDNTVADLVSLLDDPDFDIRTVVAVALGQLGRRAKVGDPVLNGKLLEAIVKVQAGRSPDERYNAAGDLLSLLKGIDLMYVDDKTVAELVPLLDTPDSGVRMFVAAALGMLGPRAKAAVPKLLALLPAADCEGGGVTSAAAIRPALERMGVKPPPFDAEYCKKELNRKLEETIAKVRAERLLERRIDIAEHLAELTLGMDPNSVNDKTVADMVSLLDDPDPGVRGWVATALGLLGPRAKVAVPKLLALLPQADCEQGSLTTGNVIRLALERMGVEQPPFNPENYKREPESVPANSGNPVDTKPK